MEHREAVAAAAEAEKERVLLGLSSVLDETTPSTPQTAESKDNKDKTYQNNSSAASDENNAGTRKNSTVGGADDNKSGKISYNKSEQ